MASTNANIRKREYAYKGKKREAWVVSWVNLHGERRQKEFPNRRHADAHRQKVERDLTDGEQAVEGGITFAKAWQERVEHLEEKRKAGDISGNTFANSATWASRHLVPDFGRRKISQITAVDVEKWVMRKRETLAAHSVHNLYSYLFEALNFFVRSRWLDSNPLRDHPVRVPGRKRRVDIPAFDDIETLIKVLNGPCPPWCHLDTWHTRKVSFALCAFGGMRVGEVAALKWLNVDMRAATVKVDEEEGTVSMYDGLKKPKSEAGSRVIPMCQYLHDALADHASNTGTRGFVVKNAKVDGYLSSVAISDNHRDLMRRAGMVKADGKTIKFPTHALRHFYASALIAIGTNVVSVAKRLGHYDASFTLKTYAHEIEGSEDGLAAKVAPIWHHRLTRAEPGKSRVIESHVIDMTTPADGTLMIEAAAQVLDDGTPIRPTASPWVPEAVRLLEGGWRLSDVARHLGLHKASICKAFGVLGMPTPDSIHRRVRDRKFKELAEQGYCDREIASLMRCSEQTVYHWRATDERELPNTRKALKTLQKQRRENGPIAGNARELQQKPL